MKLLTLLVKPLLASALYTALSWLVIAAVVCLGWNVLAPSLHIASLAFLDVLKVCEAIGFIVWTFAVIVWVACFLYGVFIVRSAAAGMR